MGKDKKESKQRFRFRMSKAGPSASGTDPTSDPGSGSSVTGLEIQQPVATMNKSFFRSIWNRSRSPSPALSVASRRTATTTPAPDASAPDITTPEPVSGPISERQSVPSADQTLWQKALDKIAEADKVGVDLNAGSLLHNLIDTTKTKKLEIEKKKWVYKNKDGEEVAYADRFLTLLNKYVGIVDIAIQHDPHVVALVWSGFRFLLQVATADMENVRMIFESLEVLVRILFRCDIYEKLYGSRKLQATTQLNTSIVQLYIAILKYLCSATRELNLPTGARILKSVFSDSGQLFKDIQTCEKDMQTDADMAEKEAAASESYAQEERTQELKTLLARIVEPIEDIVRAIAKMNKSVDMVERARILRWISDIPVQDHHIFSRERRHKKTGDWLLQHDKFREWRNSNVSSMLWLRGGAGAGKTILASKVIDEFQSQLLTEQQHTVVYFYCNYREPARRDPASVLRALVKQLCLVSPSGELPEPILLIYQTREKNGHQSGALHLSESRDLIVQLSTAFTQTTIVIDALDECNRETRRDLFDILKHIIASTKNVRIFVTGRSDGDIRKILCGFPSHYIEATDNQGDIGTYINSEIERCCREKLLLDGEIDEGLKSDIVSALIKGADGMFMWVHLQFSAICRGRTPTGIRNALRTLPKGLEETYILILKRISDIETDETVRVVYTVLKWILFAQELCGAELVSDVLSAAMGEYRWKPSAILDICQNLIVFDERLNSFRFAHYSVQEFLVGRPEFDEEGTHTGMAEICLTALLRYPDPIDPVLLNYSTEYWATHVRLSSRGNSTLEGLWKRFLQYSPAYTAWGLRIKCHHEKLTGEDFVVVSPLWVACYYQLYSIFEFLLGNGANGNSTNNKGVTPLLYAAKQGYSKFVELLIENPSVDINYKPMGGCSVLLKAAGKGDGRVVRILLEKDGVDLNSQDYNRKTALSRAAANGHGEVVEILLAKDGVNPDFKDTLGRTPLCWAAENGHGEVVEMLLEKDGVDVNSKNDRGQTALSRAAGNGRGEVVKMLLAKDGVNPELKDTMGRTPLFWAAGNGHRRVVKMLLAKDGVDPNSENDKGQTPLSWAAENGYEEIVQILLAKDRVDPNSRDNEDRTALSHVVTAQNLEVVQA